MAAGLPRPVAELLAEAFASEVTERLPELQSSIAACLATDDRESLRVALRHVHTLASSAVVLGEHEVSVVSRRCEERLVRALGSSDHDVEELAGAAQDVDQLSRLLSPWLARGAA